MTSSGLDGQGEREGRALAGRGLDPDATAVHLDDAPGDGQAETGAPLRARRRAVDLLELLEDPLLVGLGDARARVRDRDAEGPVGRGRLQADLAGLGELDRVADEVQQDLGEAALVAVADGQVGGDRGLQRQVLLGGEGLRGGQHRLHDVLHRVLSERQAQLPCLDLGEIEDVVDQAEQVAAARLDAFEDLPDALADVAVDVVQEQLRVAEDRVERGAELVTHVGEELGLVPAGDLELAALGLDLAEEPRVLEGQRRLRGERGQERDDWRRELAGSLAAHHEPADDPGLPPQRDGQERPVPRSDEEVAQAGLIDPSLADVGDLDRFVRLGQPADRALAVPKRRRPGDLHQLILKILRRAQVERPRDLLVLEDRAGVRARELGGAGDDGREHGFQVEG
jgi:hypothetical protein